MRNQKTALWVCSFITVMIAGCGGGGGSGGGASVLAPPAPVAFTSWSAVAPNTSIAVPGISQDTTYTYNVPGDVVTSIGPVPAVSTSSSYTATYNGGGAATKVALSTPTSSASFDTALGDAIGSLAGIGLPQIDAAVNAALTNVALAANPTVNGWNYQSYGIWETGVGTGSGRIGVMSVGAPTGGVAIPTTSSAVFTGSLGGLYSSPTGVDSLVAANVSVNANFVTRSLAFTSTGTILTQDLTTFTAANNLNLSGTLTYAAGVNSFTGTLTTAGATMNGVSTGRFYGPTAQELGGVFMMKAPAGLESFAGAYGAKRP